MRHKLAVAMALAVALLLSMTPLSEAQSAGEGLPSPVEQQSAADDVLAQLDALDGPISLSDLLIDPALGPPPWTSIVPGRDQATVDAWIAIMERINSPKFRPEFGADAAADSPLVEDIEESGEVGLNDTIADGQLVSGFGSGAGESDFARIVGALDVRMVDPGDVVRGECESEEEDGSIDDANDVLIESGDTHVCLGEIGDGDYGDSSGDFDHYAVEASAGESIIAATDGTFDTFLTLYSDDGSIVALDDDGGPGLNSLIEYQVRTDGTYYVAVRAFGSFQDDPFDPSSGRGARSTGSYELDISRGPATSDTDVYLVDLDVGDAISVGLQMSGSVSIVAPDGRLGQGSTGSAVFLYPPTSPLRHIGNVGADFVVEQSGIHAVLLTDGPGLYAGELRVARAGLETESGDDAQIIFLDFDGGEFRAGTFDERGEDRGPVRTLSPLVDFLPAWGLDASDEDAVIDAVIASVEENLLHDLHEVGGNGNRDATGNGGELDVEIRNSRDHGDIWGEPNVSRVIIGGTIPEAGISTVGIAQSIDPGNLDTTETAIVLLDVLSAPAGDGFTLNAFGAAAPLTTIDVVGEGVGVITAHEIGHYIGNWHTTRENETFNVMDEGGDLVGLVGVGPDLTLGTADDNDTDFVTDVFSFGEGFRGRENTTVRSAQALSTGQTDVPVRADAYCADQLVTINMQEGDAGIGTPGNDVILGTVGDDEIDGRGGNDTICGLSGNDMINGGTGRDLIYAGPGDDEVRGGDANDQIFAQEGDDLVIGNDGNDVISGGSGNDRLLGSTGRDTIRGLTGDDRITGGQGADTLIGGGGRDNISGGGGDDELRGNGGNDVLRGNAGDDALNGGSGQDTCRGDGGTNSVVRCER